MRRGRRLPKTKAVMVLGGEDGVSHSSRFSHPRPLTAIEVRGMEECRILGPVAPLPTGKRVDAKVNEEAKLEILPV